MWISWTRQWAYRAYWALFHNLSSSLDNFKHLEVLNMCHCQMKEVYQYEVGFTLYREIDPPIIEKSSRLKKFLTCQRHTCDMCKWKPYNERVLDWTEFEQRCWREDEVSSLAH